jgi:TonB family protein
LNGTRKTVFKWVTGTHVAVLFLLLFIPWIKGCFYKEPKIIATIDLGAPPPPPAEVEPEPVPEPEKPKPAPQVEEPVPKPPPTNAPPKPKPVVTNAPPKPKPVVTNAPPKPKPVVTNAPPKPKPVVTNAPPKPKPPPTNAPPKKAVTNTTPKKIVTNAPAAKPKTEAEKLAEIRKGGKRVSNPNASPARTTRSQPDFSGLKAALNSAAPGTGWGTGSGPGSGAYSPFAWYYESVKRQMYSVWQQPAGAPIGLTASATVRVASDGTVSSKAITRRSGNMLFDQSVQSALNDTAKLPAPPAGLPSRTLEIEFELSD